MYCKRIKVENFRNIAFADVELCKGVNILLGENAQGKTNLLESIYMTSLGKSFRAGVDRDVIRFGEEYAKIENTYFDGIRDTRVSIGLFSDRRAKQIPYPSQLQTLNSKRNPNSYYFLRKIAEHKNMNVGKKNEDIIAVKTLLSVAPHIPTYEEVMQTSRALTRQIIEPFERDLDALEETLSWTYCHSNNTPLTDEELATLSYDTFKGLLIHTEWKDYPDQTARLQRKAELIEQSKAKTKGKSKKVKTG